MAVRDVIKVTRKTFLNPRGWLGYDLLKNQTQTIFNMIKGLFTYEKPTRTETFQEAVKRLDLTEENILQGIQNFRRMALIFAVTGLLIFFYSFFILFRHGSIFSFLLGMVVSSLAFGFAFRYDFWAYQMRSRRLGVTFKEWLDNILGSKGSAK